MRNQKVQKFSLSRLFFDRRRNPPEYVPEELPTQTAHIFIRTKQGTMIDSSHGETKMGSVYFTGSHYDFAPGTYSLRIIRRNAAVGSQPSHSIAWWKLHHSRLGTVDAIPFRAPGTVTGIGVQVHETLGGPKNPVYAFGPGTITHIMYSSRGSIRVSASMEGIFG